MAAPPITLISMSSAAKLIGNLRESAGLARDYIYWGVKNYVESALYVGVLPLFLAAYGLVKGLRRRAMAPYVLLFGLLAAYGAVIHVRRADLCADIQPAGYESAEFAISLGLRADAGDRGHVRHRIASAARASRAGRFWPGGARLVSC